jgi:hypothetical protein
MPTGSQEPSSFSPSLRPFVRRARVRRWLRRRRRIIVGAIIIIALILAFIAFIIVTHAHAPVGGQLVAMPDGSLP